MQAPYVIRHDSRYWMFYGDWAAICLVTSSDGKTFARHRGAEGRPQLEFTGAYGFDANTRDAMVLRIGERWHLYYTAHPDRKGAVYVRTSSDLKAWSAETMVSKGGIAGEGPFVAECPFVVEPRKGEYYLFRTQTYGKFAKTHVYRSRDPMDFGIDDDVRHLVTTLPSRRRKFSARRRLVHGCVVTGLELGIQIARLEWSQRALTPLKCPSGRADRRGRIFLRVGRDQNAKRGFAPARQDLENQSIYRRTQSPRRNPGRHRSLRSLRPPVNSEIITPVLSGCPRL